MTAGVLAVLLAITGIVWLCLPKTQEVTIQSFEWDRSIEIEEYKALINLDYVSN